MEVKTATPQVEQQRAVLTELLMADQPGAADDPKETTTGDNLLLALARRYAVGRRAAADRPRPRDGRLQSGHPRRPRRLHPVRPLRPRLRRHPGQRRHRPLGQGLRGADRVRPQRPDGRVDVRDVRRVRRRLPDGRADEQADPRGRRSGRATELKSVDSVCPYCGVGCALTYHVDEERNAIAFAEGRDQPGNQQRLCVKGRYGWDYAASPQRLTTPLIRVSYPKAALSADVRGEGRGRKRPGGIVDYDEVHAALPRGDVGRGARPVAASRLKDDPRASTARARSPASAPRSAPTRRPTSSRS